MKMQAMWIGCAAVLIGTGCVSTLPPVQLMSARGAYGRAEAGIASRYATAELLDAKIALEAAEVSFAEQGDVARTRDLAYVARRKAQLAAVVGESVEHRMTREQPPTSVRAERAERADTLTR